MTAWIWVEEEIALAIHDRSLIEHGGAPGVRDLGLLQSALGRAEILASYDEGADAIALATAYTAGIVRNHPFIDGNKRTGFVVGVLFLELNGVGFVASEEAATRAVIDLAAGDMSEEGYGDFLRENVTI